MSHRTKSRAAFTLVELLVAVGIIVVLLGILLPAIGKVQQTARVVRCTGNLRQIDQTFHVWSLNYGSMHLPGTAWPATVQKILNTQGAATASDYQTSADKIMTCPDADPTWSSSTTTVTIPDGTDLPSALVEFQKENGGHPVNWVQNSPNQWTATEIYQKAHSNYATFVFTRVSGNTWNATPTYIDPHKAGSVGPPLSLYSVYDNKLYPNVQVGQSYLISGEPVPPNQVTTITVVAATSYGINVGVSGQPVGAIKSGRVLVMDYNQSTVDSTSDDPTKFLIGRHYKMKMHNALMTDGSVQLMSVKQLNFANAATVYLNQ